VGPYIQISLLFFANGVGASKRLLEVVAVCFGESWGIIGNYHPAMRPFFFSSVLVSSCITFTRAGRVVEGKASGNGRNTDTPLPLASVVPCCTGLSVQTSHQSHNTTQPQPHYMPLARSVVTSVKVSKTLM